MLDVNRHACTTFTTKTFPYYEFSCKEELPTKKLYGAFISSKDIQQVVDRIYVNKLQTFGKTHTHAHTYLSDVKCEQELGVS